MPAIFSLERDEKALRKSWSGCQGTKFDPDKVQGRDAAGQF
jgi:hypothetical protein